jgi:hypothetical protein
VGVPVLNQASASRSSGAPNRVAPSAVASPPGWAARFALRSDDFVGSQVRSRNPWKQAGKPGRTRDLSRLEVAFWILCLIAIEVQHLKWIIWEHWDCRKHGVKNKECRCKARLIILL